MTQDKAFNLLYENWIPVRLVDYSVQEVSLLDIFENASEYLDLACASPTENAALLRFLLAVTYTVVSRYDVEGTGIELENAEEALERWEAFWQLRKFPDRLFKNYLEQYRERFWLFHPEIPFMQVKEAAIGTEYSAAKLNPEVMESSNKLKLFSVREGAKKRNLNYAEAARGLLHINAFDDKTSKPKGKNLPSIGVGWVGELGIVYAVGNNLFETLMINLCIVDEDDEIGAENNPIWEHQPNTEERKPVAFPDNQAELLTVQSRRLLLKRDEQHESVVGFTLLGGDILSKENAFAEQMTFWKKSKPDKEGKVIYSPKPFNPDRLIWRDFPALFFKDRSEKLPGVVSWISRLSKNGILKRNKMIHYRFVSAVYDQYPIKDVYADELSFYLDVIEGLDSAMQQMITDEIENCEKTADICAWLEKDLHLAAGTEAKDGAKAKEQIYSRMDQPFRQWLSGLQSGGLEVKRFQRSRWEDKVYDLAMTYGRELVQAAGSQSLRGRTVTIKEKNKEVSRHYSSAEAFISFKRRLNKLLKGQGI